MDKRDEHNGPRIGIYYGVVVDQEHLTKKVEPVDIASIVERITKITPFDSKAEWKIDYDRSQCRKTIVIYHTDYTKIIDCPGYVGGWGPHGSTKFIPKEILDTINLMASKIEEYVQPNITDTSYVMIGIGYCLVYFIA